MLSQVRDLFIHVGACMLGLGHKRLRAWDHGVPEVRQTRRVDRSMRSPTNQIIVVSMA